MHFQLAFLQLPSFPEMLLIAAIGLLFFGKRLPEVGRSLGKGIVEFKKGIRGIEDDIDLGMNDSPPRQIPQQPQAYVAQPYSAQPGAVPQSAMPPVQPQVQPAPPAGQVPYRFDPYTGKPIEPPSA